MGNDDEAGRSRRRQSRGRQPGNRAGAREPEYKRSKEPKYGEQVYREPAYRQDEYKRRDEPRYREEPVYREELRYREVSGKQRPKPPELNLITDSFRNDRADTTSASRQQSGRQSAPRSAAGRQKPSSGPQSGSRKAGRQSAAAKMPDNGAYHTPAQKKAQKKKRRLTIILIEILILVSVLVFAAYSYLNKSMNMIQRLPWNPGDIKNVEISEEKQEQMKGYWTIAVFGVDSRNSSVGKGNNSDVNIICNINQDTGEIKLISVFRDTYLNISDKNAYNKINAAYLNGGPEQAVKVLNKNLDLDIDDYATFNWKAVADAINILGGIDIELSKAEFYYINAFVTETVKATGIPSEPVKKAGMAHLDGVQAVAYGRLRLMDTDYARTERQRKIIALAFEKAKKADWATLNNIIQTVFPQVATSVEMTDVLKMGRGIEKLHLGESLGFPAARGDADMGSKGDCVIPQTLESNVRELHSFMFDDENYEPTELVRTISKKIISDTGLAKAKKPVDHVDTDNGVIPKTTEETGKKDKTKESTEESESRKPGDRDESESRESGASDGTRPGRPGVSQETDALGNVIISETRESESGTVKPGTGRPGTTQPETRPGTTQPSNTAKPGVTQSTEETISPRPGGGSTENSGNGTINAPGSNTDTGVILGPGTGASGSGSGNAPGGSQNAPGTSQNAPGSSNQNATSGNQNAPGSGSTSGGSGNNSQAPGSGTSGNTGPVGP